MWDFLKAALPWVTAGLAIAFFAANVQRKRKTSEKKAKRTAPHVAQAEETDPIADTADLDDADEKGEKDDDDGTYMSEGMCVGMALGVAFGSMNDNQATWMSLGMLIGMSIGMSIKKK